MNQMEIITHRAYRGFICERLYNGKWKVEDHYGKPVNTFRDCKDIVRKKLEFLNHHEKQIILQSKGWFGRENEIENLRIIVADLCNNSVHHTELNSIYYWMIKLFLKLQKANYITVTMDDFLEGLFTWQTPSIDREAMIDKMMSYISSTYSSDLNLGKPDYTLLPECEREKAWYNSKCKISLGGFAMNQVNEQSIYQQHGFTSRKAYLISLSEEFNVPFHVVREVAFLYGESEDFDGLVSAMHDYEALGL